MNSRKITILAFVLLALVQIYVPAKIIINRTIVLNSGKEFKFRTAPIDPGDPFRGKYIDLYFNENSVAVQNTQSWARGETVFVVLTKDHKGFAKLTSVSKQKPKGAQDFLIAKAGYVNPGDSTLSIDFPFKRFYMEESKAYDAELTYRRVSGDTSQIAYAVVNIKNGESVLKDVMINGVSIKEMVRQQQNKK
jgi:uncharacterized membrane-anchored protein